MFEGFRKFDIQTSDSQVRIHGVVGGSGPPLLLIHGNPLTHVHWHLVAPRLAQHFTVVATDLRGYGDSSKPRGLPDHSNYTFRRMGQDQVDVMAHLGFDKFSVAGHDRGARTAYRMALDNPARVLKFASVDIIPTHFVLTHINREWALNSYHWFFMAQPYDIPEKLLEGKEQYYIEKKLTKMGIQGRLHAGDARRIRALLHAGKPARRMRGLPRCGDARFRDGPRGLRGGTPDPVPDAGGLGRAKPYRKNVQPARGVAVVRGEHRQVLPAAVRPLSGGAGAGRNLQ